MLFEILYVSSFINCLLMLSAHFTIGILVFFGTVLQQSWEEAQRFPMYPLPPHTCTVITITQQIGFFFFLTRNETSLKLDDPSKSIVNLRVSSWCVHFMKKKVKVLVTQSCPTLCHPVDGSTPGSSVHRLLQARILEWAAILFSGESSRPRDSTSVSCFAGRFFTI